MVCVCMQRNRKSDKEDGVMMVGVDRRAREPRVERERKGEKERLKER